MKSKRLHNLNLWDALTVLLWFHLLVMGLFPERVFSLLRDISYVTTQHAFTNSYWFITLFGSAFVGVFSYVKSLESGDQEDFAVGKGIQVGIISLSAFLPLQLDQALEYLQIPVPFFRNLMLLMIVIKFTCWLYLVQLFIRYYVFYQSDIFLNMPLMFPSARRAKKRQQEMSVISESSGVDNPTPPES